MPSLSPSWCPGRDPTQGGSRAGQGAGGNVLLKVSRDRQEGERGHRYPWPWYGEASVFLNDTRARALHSAGRGYADSNMTEIQNTDLHVI